MNKFFVYSSLLITSLSMVGCASDNYSSEEVESNDPVVIQLNAGAVNLNTRASIESVGVKNAFECDNLGFFMLAKEKTGINANALDINWSPSSDASLYTAWWDNVPGSATITYVDEVAETHLETSATGQYAYYPIGNWYTYNFYAFQPRVGSTLQTSSSYRRAKINIDGTQDVIWGKASSDVPLAYSAKYFNQPAHVHEIPSLDMEHKMMRLQFAVVAGADGTGNYAPALTMGVRSIEIVNCPTQGTLIIADRLNPGNDGTLTFDWTNNLANLPIRDANDAEFSGFEDHRVTMETTNVGQGIILPVPDSPTYIYRVKITMEDINGVVYNCEHPLELSNNAVYEAGKSYLVVMTVRGPKEIGLKPTLSSWDNETQNIVFEFD